MEDLDRWDLPHLVIVSHNPLAAGGFQTVVRNLAPRLSEKWRVDIIGLEDTYSPLLPILTPLYGIYEAPSRCALKYYVEKLDPDVIMVFGAYWHIDQYVSALEEARRNEVLYLVVEGPPIPAEYERKMERFDLILTPCLASAEIIASSGFDVYVAHFGVDHSLYKPMERERREFVFGSVKVNNPKAMFQRLLEGFATASKEIEATLTLIAARGYRKGISIPMKVENLGIKEKVKVRVESACGIPVKEKLMPEFYNSLSCYVSVSGGDTCDLPSLEAAACGIPVIHSDLPGPREYLGDGALYIPIESWDPLDWGTLGLVSIEELSKAMIDVYKDEDLRSELSRRALANSNKWSWERALKEVELALKEVYP